MMHSSISFPVDRLHTLRECTSARHGPPLDDVGIRVAWGKVLENIPDPMSTHCRSLLLMSFVFTFGPGWLLLALNKGFGWPAFCPRASCSCGCRLPASSALGGQPVTDPSGRSMSQSLGVPAWPKWAMMALRVSLACNLLWSLVLLALASSSPELSQRPG